jgi:hypothetical protein
MNKRRSKLSSEEVTRRLLRIFDDVQLLNYTGYGAVTELQFSGRCRICGESFEAPVTFHYLLANLVDDRTYSCGCYQNGSRNHSWSGSKDGKVCGSRFYKIKEQALKRNKQFDLDIEYLAWLLAEQDYKCKYTGITLTSCSAEQGSTASLDRIDSSKGYVEGNVQWVHKDINKMKLDFSEERFIELCKAVAKRN